MTWDAKMLRKIFNDEKVTIDAAALISIITDYSFDNLENTNAHYFRVTMENVTNEVLLDVQQVRDYLSMVAPVPFANFFTHKNKIYQTAKEKNITIDEYNVYVNTDQLFKGYKNYMYKNNAILEKATIIDVNFIETEYNNKLLYWGWYGVSDEMKQIPDENKERGFRLRKSNIQIGLETTLDKYHQEKLGNRYFIGEIYAINKELIPNGRRDFFIDNDECEKLKASLKKMFADLKKFYYDFSYKNTDIEVLQKFDDLSEKLNNNLLNQETKEDVLSELKSIEKKVAVAKKRLPKLAKKHDGQVLGNIIKEAGYDFKENDGQNQQEEKQKYTEFNTQKIIVNKKSLSSAEEVLLQKVYAIIRKNLIKATAEELIQKIDEEVRI